jgi:deoxyribonuclease-2
LNDQPPDESDAPSTYAHLKGVLLFDQDNGLYLVHSAPHFPPDPSTSGWSYPSSSAVYGQSFSCFSFSFDQLEQISQNLLIERPYVYASNFPAYAATVLPSLKKVIDGEYDKTNTNRLAELNTRGGQTVYHLAKSRSWGLDLYHDFVAPTFKGNVYSETWCLGTGTLPSDCSGSYEAHNILNVNFKGYAWKRTQDHSKWGLVGQTVCIGDINRQSGQLKRGGGTFCRTDVLFAAEIKNTIIDVEDCS